MKQIYFLFVVLLVVMTACGGKKEASVDAEQLMFQIDSVDHVTGLQRMQVSRIDQHIVSGGKKYNLFIERAPSDSLPSVKSDLGIFADNRIIVRISRENGSRVFAKTFTKQSFSGFVSADHLRHFSFRSNSDGERNIQICLRIWRSFLPCWETALIKSKIQE